MGYAVVQLYDPIKKAYTDPKITERLDAVRICLNRPATMGPAADTKEEAVWKYWMSRSRSR